MDSDHGKQLILKKDPLLLEVLHRSIAPRLDLLLDPADFPVDKVIFLEKPCEMLVCDFQLVDRVGVLGQIMPQVVMFSVHLVSLLLVGPGDKHIGCGKEDLDMAQSFPTVGG